MIRWVSQLETWLETENDFCEWDRLEHECQFWASLAGYRMSCPTWQKEGERDVHFWDFVCTCCFALWCHLMCLYVWFMLRVIFPYIGFSMTYTWYIALLWRFATSVALVKVWFAPKVSCSARFIGDDETQQRYTFRLLWVLWLHGEHSEDLNLYSDMENQTIFHMFCFSFCRQKRRQKCTKESWEDRRIHFVTSEEGTLFDIDRRSLVCFVSQWW